MVAIPLLFLIFLSCVLMSLLSCFHCCGWLKEQLRIAVIMLTASTPLFFLSKLPAADMWQLR